MKNHKMSFAGFWMVVAAVMFLPLSDALAGITVVVTNHSAKTAYIAFHGNGLDMSETTATLPANGSHSFTLRSISSGRIYVSQDAALDFGGGEPDGANPADANYHKRFDKVELTYQEGQYAGGNANLTAVDFYGIPMILETAIGNVVIEHFTLATNETGHGVQAAISNILTGTHKESAIVNTAAGGFARLLAPVKAPAAYRVLDAYVNAVSNATFDIAGTFYGKPVAAYHFTGTTHVDRITLGSGTNQVVVMRDTLRYDANNKTNRNGIYTCDAPYLVNGVEKRVGANDLYAAVYRDLVTAFNLGVVSQGLNHSATWWTRAAFPQDGLFHYNQYAKAIADHYPGAYGFPFSDRHTHVLSSLGGKIDTLRITILGDDTPAPPVVRTGTWNPQDGAVRFTLNLFARDKIRDGEFTFNQHTYLGGKSYRFPSTTTQWGQDDYHAMIENIPAQPGLNIYDLAFGPNKYQILVQVTNGAVAWGSAAGGADATWAKPVLYVGGVKPGQASLFGDPEGEPTEGWSEYARYGDYLSAQMKSLRKFGYGMYVAKMRPADGPVCSTFWLYADAPAPGCMPEIAQMWRWNEFDYEFVPYTRAYQNSYITLDGSFTNLAVNYYGSELDLSNPDSQLIKSNAVNWVHNRFMSDDIVMADMQRYYNRWMINPADSTMALASNDHSFAGAVRTTGPGHNVGGHTNTPGALPGWRYASEWKYPLTAVKATPDHCDMRQMTAINWWRTPSGKQSIDVVMPGIHTQKYEFIVKQDVIGGSTAPQSYTPAAMNNETYVFPGTNSSFDPYTNLNTYTIVWSKSRVAFYINAGADGTDIAGATPVAVHELAQYPSMSNAGPQAAQGKIPWVDTSLSDPLGEVSINLANYVAFKAAVNISNSLLTADQKARDGWSGYPPGSNWAGANAYIRSVKYYPLASENNDGSQRAHFDFHSTNAWLFDLGDGTWSATNFGQKMAQYFGVLYAQDYTKNGIAHGDLRDSKSPLAVEFDPNDSGSTAPDSLPLMRLLCKPSVTTPQRNFFRVGTTMNTGAPINDSNPFMYVTVAAGGGAIGISGASTPLSFYAPPQGHSCIATVKLYMSTTYHGSFPSNAVPSVPAATATLALTNDAVNGIAWSVVSDPNGIIVAYQSENPHLITVQRGTSIPPALPASPYQEDGYLKTTDALWWHPADALNEGGSIAHYHVQVALDDSFGTILVNVTNQAPTLWLPFYPMGPMLCGVMLSELPGTGALQPQTEYAWRIRAEDNNGALSEWISSTFSFGVTPPEFEVWVPAPSAGWQLAWSGESTNYVVQFRTNLLTSSDWQTVGGVITNQTQVIEATDDPSGYYRVVVP